MERPKHTFVITAHKESPFLEECILSLRAQTVKSGILISTSTPSSFLDLLSGKYGIPVIVNNSASGIASDWSFAYGSCATKYITLAHQDDIYLPEYTEYCLAAAENRGSDSLITFTDYSTLYRDAIATLDPNLFIKKIFLLAFFFRQDIRSAFIRRGILSFGNPIACPSVMYNKELIGSFEFSRDLCCNMDWDAWIRLSARRGSFVYVKKKLVLHRVHENSQTSLNIKNRTRKSEDEKVYECLWPRPVAKVMSDVYYLAARFYGTRR